MKITKTTIETKTYQEISSKEEMIYFLKNSYLIYKTFNSLDNIDNKVMIENYTEEGFIKVSEESDCLYNWTSVKVIPYDEIDYSQWVAFLRKVDSQTEVE